jgi:hypothetical protein
MDEKKVVKTEIFESVVVRISDKHYEKKLWLEQYTYSDGSLGFKVCKEVVKRSPSDKTITLNSVSHLRH